MVCCFFRWVAIFCLFVGVPLQALQFSFNRLANDFHILDQVLGSLPPFFHIKAYTYVLRERFRDDDDLLKHYRALRQKYQRVPAVFSVSLHDAMPTDLPPLFAPAPEEVVDPMCDAFFTSTTLDEALTKLHSTLEEDERLLVRQVFDIFGPRLDALYATNAWGLAANLDRLNRAVDQDEDDDEDEAEEGRDEDEPTLPIETHLDTMRTFYGVDKRPFRLTLLLWCPKGVGFSGNAYGDHLILSTSGTPIPNEDTVSMLVSLVAHEATHHIAGCMPRAKKERLSRAFAAEVGGVSADGAAVSLAGHPLLRLEEPLVMATQMVLVYANDRALFERQKKWFNHPAAHRFFAHVRQAVEAKTSQRRADLLAVREL